MCRGRLGVPSALLMLRRAAAEVAPLVLDAATS